MHLASRFIVAAAVAALGGTSSLPAQAQTAANDQARVRSVVQRYLHGLKFNDTVDFHAAFLPDARLMFVRADGSLGQLTQAEWYRGFAASAGKEEEGELRIDAVDITGNAAAVKVVEVYPKSRYTDYLNLLRLGDEWRIVNKIYVAEKR